MAQADRIPGSDGGTLADLQSLIALRGEARAWLADYPAAIADSSV